MITFEEFCNRVNEDRKREIKEAVDRASEITEEMLEDILDILTTTTITAYTEKPEGLKDGIALKVEEE